jgi:deazaflavin-dependent oxidoreductase (nitroreductase family)
MAKSYRRGLVTRLVNRWFRLLTDLGLGASYRHVLTVTGRRSGRLYSTPVDVIETNGSRWLVAGYGPVSWVENARASGEVTLSRGGRAQTYAIEAPRAPEAIAVLRTYMAEIRVTRAYFDATPDSTDEAIAAELPRHAVFRLLPRPA